MSQYKITIEKDGKRILMGDFEWCEFRIDAGLDTDVRGFERKATPNGSQSLQLTATNGLCLNGNVTDSEFGYGMSKTVERKSGG